MVWQTPQDEHGNHSLAVRLSLVIHFLWAGQLCGVLSTREGDLDGCWDGGKRTKALHAECLCSA